MENRLSLANKRYDLFGYIDRSKPCPPVTITQNQTIKAKVDELAILSATIDDEDLTEKILDNLGGYYRKLVLVVQSLLKNYMENFSILKPLSRVPKVIHYIFLLLLIQQIAPTTRASIFQILPLSQDTSAIGYHLQQLGHTAKHYPSFRLVPVESSNYSSAQISTFPWQPKANFATNTSTTPTWLLDNSASYHVTSNLNNLSLHTPYPSSDDIMIGDGTTLPITHTGSISLQTSDT
ncbi:polyprotein [Gossypium australe]|uniref:Polyprotein n=1 Tax=Gossypium australe TaxID=47621 RepID=A0A5B6WFQ4_9ROSI|nr:polyprotein [Gossypium australe]